MSDVSGMLDIQQMLRDLFSFTVAAVYPDLKAHQSIIVPGSKFGDYQCNSPMMIAGALKNTSQKAAPREIAEALISALPENPIVEKVGKLL